MSIRKKTFQIIKWVITSIVMQIIILSLLNYIYLPSRGKVMFSVLKSEIVTSTAGYYAYSEGDAIVIGHNKQFSNKKVIKIPFQTPAFFRWLEDRDIIIYAFKNKEGKGTTAEVKTYDLKTNLEKTFPKIIGLSEGSFVYNIEASPFTNMVYVQIASKKDLDYLYSYDITDKLEKALVLEKGNQIRLFKYVNKLLFEKNNDIYIYDGFAKTSKVLYFDTKISGLRNSNFE